MQKAGCHPPHVGLQREKFGVLPGGGVIGQKLRRLPIKEMRQLRIIKINDVRSAVDRRFSTACLSI